MSTDPFRLRDGRRDATRPRACAACSTRSRRSYDLMNDLMSMGLHRAWKAYTVVVAERAARATGCSTSPAAPATWRGRFARRSGRSGRWCTPTSTKPCCAPAATACSTRACCCRPRSATPSSCRFADASFDLVSVAFGLRNMTHKERALAEMSRVLRPGGRLLVLEFSKVAAAAAERPTTGIRSRCCRGSASWWPATTTATATWPRSIRMHPDQAGAEGHDEDGRFRPCRLSQPDRRRGRAARWNQVLMRRRGRLNPRRSAARVPLFTRRLCDRSGTPAAPVRTDIRHPYTSLRSRRDGSRPQPHRPFDVSIRSSGATTTMKLAHPSRQRCAAAAGRCCRPLRCWPAAATEEGQGRSADRGQGQQGRDHRPPDQLRAAAAARPASPSRPKPPVARSWSG